jgi:hypothetical protein
MPNQGCQMVCFQIKNTKLVNFGGSCNGSCWYILWPFGLFYDNLVNFVAIWYILWLFGTFFPIAPKKSGNPDLHMRINDMMPIFGD